MKVTLVDIRKFGVGKGKIETLTIFDKFFYRPISNIFILVLFNFFKLSPNLISILSMFVAASGFLFFIFGGSNNILVGSSLLMVWAVLDCADGSLARTLFSKYGYKNPLGEFFDAFAGYFVVGFLWFSLGWSVYQISGDITFFILGCLTSILGLFARVSYSKLALVKFKNNLESKDVDSRRTFMYSIYENLEFGSALFPLLFISFLFQLLPYLLLFYFILNLALVFWFFRLVYIEFSKNVF